MSRRRNLWRKKLGYDPMPLSQKNAKPEAWTPSQCGGSYDKLEDTKPGDMRRNLYPASMKRYPIVKGK